MTPHFSRILHRQRGGAAVRMLAILALFLLFSLIVVGVLRLVGPVEDYDARREGERIDLLKKVRRRDALILNSYGWVDPKAHTVRIPIDQAMRLAVERLRAKPIRPADLVAPPVLPAASVPVPSTPPRKSP